jgi:5-methylcytosine-specific restriction endonuclease McrA
MDRVLIYRKKALSCKPRRCARCKTKDNLTVHHIDQNRQNNDLNNLRILCKKCHDREHGIKPKTKYNKKYQKGTPKNKRK